MIFISHSTGLASSSGCRWLRRGLQRCQNDYQDLTRITLPDTRLALPLRRYLWILKRYLWYIRILGPFGSMLKVLSSTKLEKSIFGPRRPSISGENLNLQPGEWIEVKSVNEIFETLDEHDKLKGLRFNPEMAAFCGRQFKVYKRLEKMIVESTGELRKIRTPTVLLQGVFCDGKAHGGCDRSCFCFWREAWLRRVTSDSKQK